MLSNLSVWILKYKYRRWITKAVERKSLSEEKTDKLEEAVIKHGVKTHYGFSIYNFYV
jgi:hypothetical protein